MAWTTKQDEWSELVSHKQLLLNIPFYYLKVHFRELQMSFNNKGLPLGTGTLWGIAYQLDEVTILSSIKFPVSCKHFNSEDVFVTCKEVSHGSPKSKLKCIFLQSNTAYFLPTTSYLTVKRHLVRQVDLKSVYQQRFSSQSLGTTPKDVS